MTRPPPWQAFFAELKRRRVFRVVTVYGVVGFVVLQAVDLLVPVLLLPEWTYRLVGILLLAGFPIAIALAWVFELTPEGLRRTDPADTAELATIVAAPRRQRWPAGLFALIATVLVLGGGWFALRGRSGEADREAANAAASAPSLAVLPFSNMAQSAETEPFVEGVHDDLLTQLSKISELRIISRTSVMGYRNTTKNVREIATELGVNHVLEGGVQRAGDQIRMNVQLIDARTDEHVWAETYNRTLTVANVFAIQSEIASAIADALHAQLSPEQQQRIATTTTDSLEAYDHYQRGLASFRRTLVAADVRRAVGEFEAAVHIDPEFAEAWARLAIARLGLSWDFGLPNYAAQAELAVRRAESLAPDRLLTHIARGYYHYYGGREYDAALAAFARAEALSPGDPEVLLPQGWVLRRMGRFEESIAKFHAALERDPRNWDNAHASLADTYLSLRRYPDARRYEELAISIAPELAGTYSMSAMVALLESGDTAAAAAVIDRGTQHTNIARILFDYPMVSRALAHRYADRVRATTSAISDSSAVSVQWLSQELSRNAYFQQKAQALRALGDVSAARAHFDSARAQLEPIAQRVPANISDQGSLHTALGIAYAALGRKQDALRYGRMGVDAVRDRDAFIEPMRRAELAEIYVIVGEQELALDEIEHLLAHPAWFSIASLRVDPMWAPLRTNPRFQRILSSTPR